VLIVRFPCGEYYVLINRSTGWDTTGNMIEHYADGDLVNKDTPVGWGAAGDESLAVWGPEVPKWFLQ